MSSDLDVADARGITPQAPLPVPGPNKNVSALETCTLSNHGYNEVWLK